MSDKSIYDVDIKRTPNKTLKVLREGFGLSVKEFADGAGVGRFAVMRAEMGKAIQPTEAILIARYCKMTVEEMWSTDRSVKPPRVPTIPVGGLL